MVRFNVLGPVTVVGDSEYGERGGRCHVVAAIWRSAGNRLGELADLGERVTEDPQRTVEATQGEAQLLDEPGRQWRGHAVDLGRRSAGMR